MNRFFDRYEWRREIPRRAYARLDDLEPIFAGPDDALTLILDAVDADWKGFAEGGPFDLTAPEPKTGLAERWQRKFAGEAPEGPDGYDDVPIYRIEISLSHRDWLHSTFPRDEEPWITLQITEEGNDLPVDIYGGLFAPATRAYLHAAPTSAPSGALDAIFDMELWPDASPEDLINALQAPCGLSALVCFDVGQGSASALVCDCGYPVYYFDVGRGSGRNAPTAPQTIDFCTCANPVVIMSHWDTDHWAGAANHQGLLRRIWVVPRQTISSTHTTFANDILAAGGRILVVPNGAPPLQWQGPAQSYDLRRGTGKGRNGTGQILIVTDGASRRAWVLTGDAGYHEIPHPVPNDIAAMVAPHHGADMGAKSVPFQRSAQPYARLFYSFGPDNAHGPKTPATSHPVSATISAHSNANWKHGTWTPATPATSLAGADVLATATHTTTHLQGAAAGWTAAPILTHLPHCANAMPVSQA
ncbi:hypothetical protein ABI_16840 [Asticcacaulis biprosthecium C19]|uniref:Uncharacterized protein n=1 Tax=Asticcacaulis biprosthecium C19 TaxID=715226 RepID=F4QK66_9CAUL|nr:hypothetical protein [Asticcacaulis biprosthecium]EGF93244.1 hypothetical protein ABI_16840 [Asticcacaulis biprosthecium C19]